MTADLEVVVVSPQVIGVMNRPGREPQNLAFQFTKKAKSLARHAKRSPALDGPSGERRLKAQAEKQSQRDGWSHQDGHVSTTMTAYCINSASRKQCEKLAGGAVDWAGNRLAIDDTLGASIADEMGRY
jgi:hypothetical protein